MFWTWLTFQIMKHSTPSNLTPSLIFEDKHEGFDEAKIFISCKEFLLLKIVKRKVCLDRKGISAWWNLFVRDYWSLNWWYKVTIFCGFGFNWWMGKVLRFFFVMFNINLILYFCVNFNFIQKLSKYSEINFHKFLKWDHHTNDFKMSFLY